MAELTHDWINTVFKLCFIGATGVGSLIGGVSGGRALIRWCVRRYDLVQEKKERERDAIAKRAASEITRKNREHDDTLADLRKQNENLWEVVRDLQDKLYGVKEEVKTVKHDMGEVQIVVGANQEKIHQVETNTKIMATAADAIKTMNQLTKTEPLTEQ